MAFVDDAKANWQASGLDRRTYDGLGSVVYSPQVYGWLVLDGRRLFPMRQCRRLRWMEHDSCQPDQAWAGSHGVG